MVDHDELRDADAAANRRDARLAAVITIASLALVLIASLLVVAGGISA